MNSIYDCVDSFKRLLHIAYIFILGRKGTHLELRVQFRKQDCFHLMGLHYLKDKAELNGSSSLVFDKILKRQISAKNIENSVYYTDNIAKRIHYLSHLEELLDSNDTVFKYDPKIQAFSVIDADVLLKNKMNGDNLFLFLSKDKQSDSYFCKSFFSDNRKEYAENQKRWTILFKKKLWLKPRKESVLYEHPAWKKQH